LETSTAFLVWDFVDGQTLDDYGSRIVSPAALAVLARELALMVESLHALGIVHGRIHGRNVIVDSRGLLHLTHISPLLYEEPADDAHDLVAMLADVAERRGWINDPVGIVLTTSSGLSLGQLRASLSRDAEAAARSAAVAARSRTNRGPRARTLIAAGLVSACGLAMTAVLARQLYHPPIHPVPPEAPAQAVNP
jgi:hypothetical protein